MTNHDLIAQVGGIERAREILEGAPGWVAEYCMLDAEYVDYEDLDFNPSTALCKSCISINDLRTAIELSGISGQLEVLEMIHVSPSCVVIDYD